MKLSIDELQKAGSFSGAPVEKEVIWEQDGETFTATTYVRKMSYQTAVEDIRAVRTGELTVIAGRIASCICDEKGKPVFTVGDITGEANPERGPLNNNLTMALLGVIADVNGMGKPGKNSAKKTNSGTSLSSAESADELLTKPSETSATENSSAGQHTEENAEA